MAFRSPWRLPIRSIHRCPQCHHPQLQPSQSRSLTTSSRCLASIAAPPIDFTKDAPASSTTPDPRLENARIVPASPSYFTGRPDSTDDYLKLQTLLRKHQTLPTVGPGQAPRVAWRTATQYRLLVGEPVRAAKYHKIVELLQRLSRIHPSLQPRELKDTLAVYKRDLDPHAVVRRPAIIDEDGKACGVGRRKRSSAKVYLVQGEGQVRVNGKSLNLAFGRVHDRESALFALKATGRLDKYNVWALVSGGGVTGQAEAMTLGAAKALMVFEPALKPALRRAGCVTRDPRKVERKKPGHVKARKMPAWVKR